MEEQIKLSAELRTDNDGAPNKLRKEGYLPASVYGAGKENILLKLKQPEFSRAFEKAGESTLVELDISGGKKEVVLVYYVQKHPITKKFLTVDFLRVDMKKELTTEIQLVFIGESDAIKLKGGNLVKIMNELEVTCLPENLVSEIKVDISPLAEIGDVIMVKDIKFPHGIKPTADMDDAVVSAQESAVEEVEAKAAPVEEKPAAPEAGKKEEKAPSAK
jgi:large subunit ribosomal protein L25